MVRVMARVVGVVGGSVRRGGGGDALEDEAGRH